MNLRSCLLTPGPVLSSDFTHPSIFLPRSDPISNSFRRKKDIDFILTTTNDKNLLEVEAEEVTITIEDSKNTSRNPNIRNNVDYRGVRWMDNNSEPKMDQNGLIPTKRWGIQTVTGEVLIKGYKSGK